MYLIVFSIGSSYPVGKRPSALFRSLGGTIPRPAGLKTAYFEGQWLYLTLMKLHHSVLSSIPEKDPGLHATVV